jgi:uncharacterized membrane protein
MKLAFRRETATPILALVFATAVCVALVIGRIAWTRDVQYGFLVWNLFLAWLPLVFALLASDKYQATSGKGWSFALLVLGWLVFFPNAPYIFTDLVHLTGNFHRSFWVDLGPILMCGLTGLVLGFVSLYLIQTMVSRMLGRAMSWLFIAGVTGLSGFGIYLGRFLRFNSWDILTQPVALSRGIGHWAANPFSHPNSYAFPALFAMFMFIAYVMLYALTHLRQMPSMASPSA